MMQRTDSFEQYFGGLCRYAALHGVFDPVKAVDTVASDTPMDDPVLMVELLSALRPICSIQKAGGNELWLMRPTVRQKMLGSAEAVNKVLELSQYGTPIELALRNRGQFSDTAVQEVLSKGGEINDLQEIMETLDQAGPIALGYRHLDALKSMLNTKNRVMQTNQTLAAGFIGREAELKKIADWISAPNVEGPTTTLHISGLPGVGKSYLLERAIQLARLDQDPILIRFDFDRSTFESGNTTALYDEISRQIGDGLPEHADRLRALRQQNADEFAQFRRITKGGPFIPRDLLREIGEVVQKSGRTVLIVADTLEVLRSRGETMVERFFDDLDRLASFGIQHVKVISAGRGDALDTVPARAVSAINLDGLEPGLDEKLLEKYNVDRKNWEYILPLAKGNPLLLLLAGKAFEDIQFDASSIPQHASTKTIAGYLYRAILSRVPVHLVEIASQGLVLQRVNAEVLSKIIGPALGLAYDPVESQQVLEELCNQHWLVERIDGWVKHRPDVREAFLHLIYQDSPEVTRKINTAAAEWFQSRDPLAALYHRLQLSRGGGNVGAVSSALAVRFTDLMLSELPERARDAVLQARGDRSGFGRGEQGLSTKGTARQVYSSSDAAMVRASSPYLYFDRTKNKLIIIQLPASDEPPKPDQRAVEDLTLMLEKHELREAGFVLANGFEHPFSANSAAGLAALVHQWHTGRWSTAQRIFNLLPDELLDAHLGGDLNLYCAPLLELWAEFRFGALVKKLRSPDFYSWVNKQIIQGPRQRAVGDALSFAMLCVTSEPGPQHAGVLSLHMGMAPDGGYHNILEMAQRQRQLWGLDREKYAPKGVILATVNPYSVHLKAFISELDDDVFAMKHLAGLRDRLPDAAKHFAPGPSGFSTLMARLTDDPADVVDALIGMGLVAEWAEGVAFYHLVPELTTLAHAAERWRQTVNGLWGYNSAPPQGWAGRNDVDEGSVYLLHLSLQESDAMASAHKALRFWADQTSEGQIGQRQINRRLTRRYCEAMRLIQNYVGQAEAAEAALAYFLSKNLPGCIAVPMAVLATYRAKLNPLKG